jgi:hypothetical protein
MYMTLQDVLLLGALIVSIIALVIDVCNKKR